MISFTIFKYKIIIAMSKVKIKNTFILLLIFSLSACSSVPRFTSDKNKNTPPPNKGPITVDNNLNSYNNYTVLETVTGVASYYADKYNGRLTSNGETYDMYGLTAAHPSYPHDTILRVTNLSNNKSVIIRVNDRMPKRPDRIIDLSLGTAMALDMVEDGITKVKLEILEWGKE